MNANFVTRLLGQLIKTPVLVKTILYLPIIPRLQKMFALMQTTSQSILYPIIHHINMHTWTLNEKLDSYQDE